MTVNERIVALINFMESMDGPTQLVTALFSQGATLDALYKPGHPFGDIFPFPESNLWVKSATALVDIAYTVRQDWDAAIAENAAFERGRKAGAAAADNEHLDSMMGKKP